MSKRIIFVLLSIICITLNIYGIDAWIRINQLGYLPLSQKKAVFISETQKPITQFTIHDALTNEELGVFFTVIKKGEFLQFKSTYELDFSSFELQGAFYIKAGLIYSPTVYINKNIYLGTADFLLNYIRNQRIFTDSLFLNETNIYISKENIERNSPIDIDSADKKALNNRKKAPTKKGVLKSEPEIIHLNGGWREDKNNTQYGATAAHTIFQLLFNFQMHPNSFADNYNAVGGKKPNEIPDVLDEAKWGLDWLQKMFPQKDSLFFQIEKDKAEKKNRVAYLSTGKPQGDSYKNYSTGMASIAGKYSSAFAMGATVLAPFYPTCVNELSEKVLDAYEIGKFSPGVSQSIPNKKGVFMEEDNWTDDMELAATQLYRLTYDGRYLTDAAKYGRMEPITPWLCSDTANYYQWFPFVNIGHYMLANVENPRYQKEFLENLRNGIERMKLRANENPFNMGVPMIQGSNNLIAALSVQCRLYRSITNDSSYLDMETALLDWLLGKNLWGKSMIAGWPTKESSVVQDINVTGGLANGAVQKSIFKNQVNTEISEASDRFQSDWAMYTDKDKDALMCHTTLSGTSTVAYLLSDKQQEGVPGKASDKNEYKFGGITRTDASKKQISLIFAGNEYAEGYKHIIKSLDKLNIKASFFLTGNFYRNRKFSKKIKKIQKNEHYLGSQIDKNTLYTSSPQGDSLLINKSEFIKSLKNNFEAMNKFNLKKLETPFFLSPYEWYNDSISQWTKEIGMQLISNTPGTLSNSDNTVPEMRTNYFSSTEIYKKILDIETTEGLNGHILLFHMGADKKRSDKFYVRLHSLLIELMRRGYNFVDLYKATDSVDKVFIKDKKKQKRKN